MWRDIETESRHRCDIERPSHIEAAKYGKPKPGCTEVVSEHWIPCKNMANIHLFGGHTTSPECTLVSIELAEVPVMIEIVEDARD